MAQPPFQPAPPANADRLIAAGRAQLRAGRTGEAIKALAMATRAAPQSVAAWTALGNALHRAGQRKEGAAAHMRALQTASRDPAFGRIMQAMKAGRPGEAHAQLAARLKAEPGEVPSLRLMALLAMHGDKHSHAFTLLARMIELVPTLEEALELARRALMAMPSQAAHAALDAQLARQPGHLGYRSFKASQLERDGDHAGAIEMLRGIIAQAPQGVSAWISLGDLLETIGRTQEAIEAYRHALSLRPGHGYAWWSLANIKANRFAPEDVQALRDLLGKADLAESDRMMASFALGKALEDGGEAEDAFARYRAGNALRRARQPYDHGRTADLVARSRALFTPAFFAARAGQGDPAPDPIFVVGLPRSGSTLIEQMLDAHPAIEGTMELPDLPRAVARLDMPGGRYPESLAALDGDVLAAIGRAYLAESRVQRRTEKPFFIDKRPANFQHVGLIRAILPNARIIDVRRHPLACGFSAFRQYFPSGFDFAHDLEDIGRYYRAYVELMAHWDAVLPGHVHRILYEDLVAEPEREVRRLLGHLGLPFDPACLRFHESGRAVRTPSASQVRQPLYTDALESWRAFEPWLEPLKAALGDGLAQYPNVSAR